MQFTESTPPTPRDDQLRAAYQRIDGLEIAIRRLTAEVLRLKATGEEQEADRLELELRDHQSEIARDRRVIQRFAPEAADTARVTQPTPCNDQTSDRNAPIANDDEPIVVATPSDKPTSFSRRRDSRSKILWDVRKQPAMALSTALHAALLLALTLFTFVRIQNPPPMLSSGVVDGVDQLVDQLDEISLEPIEANDSVLPEVSFENVAPERSELELNLPLTSVELPTADPAMELGTTDLLALDANGLLAQIGGGDIGSGAAAGSGAPPAGKGQASFFGRQSRGNRFAFLIDNSGTMQDGRMETAFLELIASIRALKADQMFYVVFYSDQAYPMFHPEGVNEMVPATREHKQQLEAWLATVELCTGGELNDAVDLAAKLEPAAMYVLSDGDIYESRVRRLIETAAERQFPIHTLGMTVRNRDDAANLVAIAEAHGGSFATVGVHSKAVQMSRARPIRYNREPGEVWGSKIRKW